jgi:hypothetical protein
VSSFASLDLDLGSFGLESLGFDSLGFDSLDLGAATVDIFVMRVEYCDILKNKRRGN